MNKSIDNKSIEDNLDTSLDTSLSKLDDLLKTMYTDQAAALFYSGKYDESIETYTKLIEDSVNDIKLLSNRCACYLKLEKYEDATKDAARALKIEQTNAKLWGRLGASLYGSNNLEESLSAYKKAYELDNKNIYKAMISDIEMKLEKIKDLLTECSYEDLALDENNSDQNNLMSKMFSSVLTNQSIVEKLSNPDFQSKLLAMQDNPFEALNDKDIMSVMSEMMKGLK